MPNPINFDDLPDEAPPAPAPVMGFGQGPAQGQPQAPSMSFDDLPDEAPVPQGYRPPAPAAAPQAPISFDDLPTEAPQVPSTPYPKGATDRSIGYLQNKPPRVIALEDTPIPSSQFAKAGTEGLKVNNSDADREFKDMGRAYMDQFTSFIQSLYLDPDFTKLSQAEKDHVLDAHISAWERGGLPAGKYNAANPNAWMGTDKGSKPLRPALLDYARRLGQEGRSGADAPGVMFTENGEIGVAKGPRLFGYEGPMAEEVGAVAASTARSIPSTLGGNIVGSIGGVIGGKLPIVREIPGMQHALGILGSFLGAEEAERAINEYVGDTDTEEARNKLQEISDAAMYADQNNPKSAIAGRALAQFLSTKATSAAPLKNQIAPRLTGGVLGGVVEAGSQVGRGEDIDLSRIAESAATGTLFTNQRWEGASRPKMTYEGRDWVNTNRPDFDAMDQIETMIGAGDDPAKIMSQLGDRLPDTKANRAALKKVVAAVKKGEDPQAAMDKLRFRPVGLSVNDTVDAVNAHIEGMAAAPEVQVHDSFDSDSIPANMKDKVGEGTLGWKDEDGIVHIVASQHADPAAVTATMFHEGMHVGLVRAYQVGLEDKLVNVFDNANPRMQKAIDKEWALQEANNKDWANLNEDQRKSLVVDEVLAGTAEHGDFKQDFDKVKAWITGFGRTKLGALGAKIKYTDAEIRMIMMTGHDTLTKGTGDGAAVGPTRYLNYGFRSKTADQESLSSYDDEQLRGGKGLPDTPEYQQGWFKGPHDNEPRYEMSDKDAFLKPDNPKIKNPTLFDVMDHPSVFEAYPHLKEVKIKIDDSMENNGSWSAKENTIYVSRHNTNPLSTLLHETQHAIQDHEGWARGANGRAVYRTAPKEAIDRVINESIQKQEERVADAYQRHEELQTWLNDPAAKRIRELNDKVDELSKAGKDAEARAAWKEYDEALKEHRASKGIDNPWDPHYHDALYRATQSKEPLDWHLKTLADDYNSSVKRLNELRKAQGDEWLSRGLVRHDSEMSDTLYNRAGGEYEARAVQARQNLDDDQRLEDPQFMKTDERGAHPNDLYKALPYTDPSSEAGAVADTRFSRKYSGTFKGDYQGRTDRTEDLLKNHFGNFAYTNLKGMMRPLEEYKALTNEDILNAAQDLKDQGFNAELAIVQGAIPDNSAFVVALRDLVRDKLDAARTVGAKYRASGGMRHERELMRAVTDLGQVLAVFDKTASNLGRMLHSLGLRLDHAKDDAAVQTILNNVRFANGNLDAAALDDLAKVLVTANDPTEIRKAMDKFDPDWKHYGQSMFYNFILGSKAVQIGNILGNATHIATKSLSDVLGYGVDKTLDVARKAGNKMGMNLAERDRMHLDELINRQSGILAALMNKATYNGYKAFNTAGKEFLIPAGQSEHQNKFASQSIQNLPISLILEYGTRGLQATDAFFRTVVEHSAMQGLATREARRLNGGEKPTNEQIAEVMASPTRDMLAKVKGEADRITFQEEPFKQAEWFSRIMRKTPGGWLLAPIIRTPSNIGRTAYETFDPTGRFTERNREALKKGGADATRVHGQQLMAAALWTGALYLMQEELLQGGGPKNPQARAQWLENYVPYSIKYGPGPKDYTPLRGISPIGDGLAVIADMRDAYKYGSDDPDQTDADVAMTVASGMARAALTNSFLSSVTDGLERGVEPTMENMAGTLVQAGASIPLVSQYKKERDPFVRDTRGAGDFMKTMADKASLMDNPMIEKYFEGVVPRSELPIRRDAFGEPILAASPTSTDPVAQEVGRLVASTGKSVIPSFSRTIKGVKVPNDLYNNFMAVAGPQLREALVEVTKDPTYLKALTDKQRADFIHYAFRTKLKGLHDRLNNQLEEMMLKRDPKFEGKYIPDDVRTITTIPGENE